jgi:hypothetical protein
MQLVEDEVEDVDVVAGRFPLDIKELEGTEIPVAGNDNRTFLGIFVIVGNSGAGYEKQEARGKKQPPDGLISDEKITHYSNKH